MTTTNVRRLSHLAAQLAETLMTAVICLNEIRNVLHADGTSPSAISSAEANGRALASNRPLLDRSTFSVLWRDKALCLGHTRIFWVLEYLARRPNQYVAHLDLMHDVWDDEELASSTIRSVIRNLRIRLDEGGMPELATAIRGRKGHYILEL
jgi:DNA-binding response OmpR family regulator